MSNLKLFQMYAGGVSLCLMPSPSWKRLGIMNATVYFRPEESVHEFVGELFLLNYNINFIPFNDYTRIDSPGTVYFLVHHEPEGLWIDGHRIAHPAKGTRVRCN